MSTSPPWRSRLGEGLVLILATALVARVVWELLIPVVPILLVGAGLLVVYRLITGKRGQW